MKKKNNQSAAVSNDVDKGYLRAAVSRKELHGHRSGSSATTAAVSEDGVNLALRIERYLEQSSDLERGRLTHSCMVQDVLFEPLAKAGQDSLEYRNASSIDVSEDGTVWTCHLNEDVTWSDGTPTTAEDWVWTFQQMTDPTFGTYETSHVILHPCRH